MATPENVLARYRSYSYHHILIACDSTETAHSLQVKGNITELQRSRDNQAHVDSKYQGMSTAGGEGDNYVVLIDGLVDSDFYITKCNWATIISPSDTGQQTMAQVDGEIEIFEPYGAVFLERLVGLCDTLGTDPTGLVFLLKTVFVGYNDHHHRFNQEMIPNVKPFLFNLIDITSVINETGSSYSLAVVGAANGFGKLPHVNNIAKGFSIEIHKGATLAATLATVEEALNQEYEDFAASLELTFSEGSNNTEFVNAGRFRPVKYKIEATDYEKSNFLAGTNELDRNSSDVDKVVLQFGQDQTIEGIIKRVMESSKGVSDDAGNEKGKAIFKINSFLRSTPTEVVVEYQVNRYEIVTASVDELSQKRDVDLGDNPNVREYDYIFTGNNTDIIEFDIKMDMGLSFFHTASTTSHEVDQVSGKQGTTKGKTPGGRGAGIKASNTGKARGKTPLFLGDKLANPKVRNKKNQASVANFNALLQRHAALENIAVTMTIHGDPSLMSEMLVTDITDAINAETKQTFMTAPALIKVNIKMPNTGINPTSFRPFWYDGYYMLHSVDSSFDNGEFTQVLTMFSIPVTSVVDEKPAEEVEAETGASNLDSGAAASVGEGATEDKSVKARMDGIQSR